MSTSEENNPTISHFESIPIELFLHICSYLEVKDMVGSLSKVCRRFKNILDDEDIWKSWVANHWNGSYPVVSREGEHFDWKAACVELETHWNMWKQRELFNYVSLNDVHISSTDAMLFLDSPSLCVSGSRDRSMILWSPLKRVNSRPLFVQKQVAHDGWIWSLLYKHNTLYSCSWDNTIKSWSLSTGLFKHSTTYRCNSPVLCLDYMEGLIIAGDFAKTVYAFDPRSKLEPQFHFTAHSRAVLTVGTSEYDIISGSEDRSLAIYDTRKRSIRQKLVLGKSAYPNCSYVDSGVLYVGDNNGAIHVYDVKNGNLNAISIFEIGHDKPISAIKHGMGYLCTSSLDGTIRFSIPTNPPSTICTVTSNGGEVGGMDYYDGMLAVGSTDLVEFWVPARHEDEY